MPGYSLLEVYRRDTSRQRPGQSGFGEHEDLKKLVIVGGLTNSCAKHESNNSQPE
jgi:hypothetical protein